MSNCKVSVRAAKNLECVGEFYSGVHLDHILMLPVMVIWCVQEIFMTLDSL